MHENLIDRLRAVRREASLNADEVAAIDRAIQQIEHLTGLSAEYLEALRREQQRYVADTDVLFLARKHVERERNQLRNVVEGLRGQLDNFERNGPPAMPVFISRSRRILARAACETCGWTGPPTQYLGDSRREITHPSGPHAKDWLPMLLKSHPSDPSDGGVSDVANGP